LNLKEVEWDVSSPDTTNDPRKKSSPTVPRKNIGNIGKPTVHKRKRKLVIFGGSTTKSQEKQKREKKKYFGFLKKRRKSKNNQFFVLRKSQTKNKQKT
jgi:hypothetical protein